MKQDKTKKTIIDPKTADAKDIPDALAAKIPYTQVPADRWTKEQQLAAVEHAIEIVTKYNQMALKSTGNNAMPLAMILCKQSLAWMLQSGWTINQIEMYVKDSVWALAHPGSKGADKVVVTDMSDSGLVIKTNGTLRH
jgi:hypothetical protein